MARVLNSHSKVRRPAAKTPVKPRKEAQQERSKLMVDTLMRATARILVKEGYAALSTNRVAALAGVSVGSLYQYFPNKDALVNNLLSEHVDQTMARMRADMVTLFALPVEKAVPRFVGIMLEIHRADPALHRVFAEQLPRVGEFWRMEASVDEGIALARAYLEAHKDEIVPKDLDLAAFVLVTTAEALTHTAVITRPQLLQGDALCDEISACLVRYLKG